MHLSKNSHFVLLHLTAHCGGRGRLGHQIFLSTVPLNSTRRAFVLVSLISLYCHQGPLGSVLPTERDVRVGPGNDPQTAWNRR